MEMEDAPPSKTPQGYSPSELPGRAGTNGLPKWVDTQLPAACLPKRYPVKSFDRSRVSRSESTCPQTRRWVPQRRNLPPSFIRRSRINKSGHVDLNCSKELDGAPLQLNSICSRTIEYCPCLAHYD